ncbi:endothelin-converting enzyme 1-like isoform X2 [Ornithodoros turicata]
MYLGYGFLSGKSIPCKSAACIEGTMRMESALNRTFPVCTSFYNFVCGSWKPREHDAADVPHDMFINATRRIFKAIDEGEIYLGAAVAKAEEMLKTCLRHTKTSSANVETFKSFMKERGLSWPQTVADHHLHPLDVLLDLAINWNVGLWFSIGIRRTSRIPPLIHIDKGSVSTLWAEFLTRLERIHRYRTYVQTYFRVFDDSDPNSSVVQDQRNDEKTILQHITNFSPGEENDALIQASNLQGLFATGQLWVSLLNKNLAPSFKVNETDAVLVSNWNQLQALDGALLAFNSSRPRLIRNIAWTFLQMYFWLAAPDILTEGTVTVFHGPYRTKITCLRLVERTFGIAIRVRFILHEISSRTRSDIDRVGSMVLYSFVSQLRTTKWIDAKSKSTAMTKIRTLEWIMWPNENLLRPHRLDAMFENLHNASSSILQTWIQCQQARKAAIGHKDYAAVFNTDFNVLFKYFYSLNTVHVSLAAANLPLFAEGGTPAMNYGSFGARYAAAVARSFDALGISFDEHGRRVSWWSQESLSSYKDHTSCRHSEREGLTLSRLVPALEAAFTAFKLSKTLNASETVKWDNGYMDDYTEDQLFFISFCHAVCAKNPTRAHRELCEAPLRNMQLFAEAFTCSRKSAMNPEKKCRFFDKRSQL